MAVLWSPSVLLNSESKPMAVLSVPIVRLMSASSPWTVLSFVKQASWQVARACRGTVTESNARTMENNGIVVFMGLSFPKTLPVRRDQRTLNSRPPHCGAAETEGWLVEPLHLFSQNVDTIGGRDHRVPRLRERRDC